MNDCVHMSDEEIVEKARVDTSYFAEVVARYQEKLARYIMRLGVRNADDRDDVLQDIFIKVYKNINGFDTSLSFSSWVYRIAHNEAISWYRKRSVRPEGHLVDDSEMILEFVPTSSTHSEVLFDTEINATEVARALGELDEKYRSVLVLRFYEHKEYDEISDILKIPIGSVGTLIHRGKKQLGTLINTESIRI